MMNICIIQKHKKEIRRPDQKFKIFGSFFPAYTVYLQVVVDQWDTNAVTYDTSDPRFDTISIVKSRKCSVMVRQLTNSVFLNEPIPASFSLFLSFLNYTIDR